ncbi:protein RECOGNITION OF PERONOSPORA PARASITICA 7-like [Euphorbia lathyris]|uniref:protein RECOGNITION OF PERONOSPORA PARASITICA 7-like n=1 Tax=Euphorbia lathyris TaxID=212925 RepID=UPI003313C682
MVDAIVSLAVERIADLLIKEAGFLSGVREEVVRLQDELKRMQCFLKDVDRKQHQDDRVRNFISEIRGVAYDSEDVIDTYIVKTATRKGGALGFINKFLSFFTKVPALHHIRNQIESIRTKIGDISTSMQTYGIQFDAETGEEQRRLRASHPYYEDEHVISFEAIKRDVKDQLMMEEEQLRVVSIVGMGGLGKTTLAKTIYNDIQIKKQFDCVSWAFISQQFSVRDVLIAILMEVAPSTQNRSDLEKMIEEELIKTLYNELKSKRYMVVLDDIWKNEAWDSLKHAFPNGKKGSKVLFTTRDRDVASYADPRSTHVEPPLLSDDEGWELLSKKAFSKDVLTERSWAPEYEILGRKMVKKSGGLPLAIVVIGGLLATKKTVSEWRTVQRNINTLFTKLQHDNQYGGVYGILALSYQALPFHLKPCFLYLSQFPEDWPIKKRTLIRMWIAEGFIQQQGDETMEDIAEGYLEEIVHRSMVQVSKRDHTGTGIKICRMHDLVRDLCILKAKEESFLRVVEHSEYNSSAWTFLSTAVTGQSRRLALHLHESEYSLQNYNVVMSCVPLVGKGDSGIRSLLYFAQKDRHHMEKQQAKFIFKNLRLLRVLNIENVHHIVHHIPREIGNLIHLRYLGLRGVYSRITPAMPSSLSNLEGLYTIDLRDSQRSILSLNTDALLKLESLRHLLLDSRGVLPLKSLRNLETLKIVTGESLTKDNAVFELTNLRNLAVYFETGEEVEMVLKSPCVASGLLRSLKMEMPRGTSFPKLEQLSSCEDLTKAALRGKIAEDSLEFLPASLTKLVLQDSELKQDPMFILEKFHNLRYLHLEDDAYNGSKMVCSANGFPQLEILKLRSLRNLKEWRIENGAMPCLNNLSLRELGRLRMDPQMFKKFVSTLKQFEYSEMSREFMSDMSRTFQGLISN